jgi:hypothetical protein
MKLLLPMIGAALIACSIPLGLWVFNFNHVGLASSSTEWSNFGSYIGGVLSPFLAFVSFVGLLLAFNTQRAEAARLKSESDDLNYFNHAVKSLERAYEAMTKNATPKVALVPERLAWLTCARLLISAKDVSGRISWKSKGLLALYAGEEEYWRHRFFELFDSEDVRLASRNASYFGGEKPSSGFRLEERSIKVIFDFFNWEESKQDPIDRIQKYTQAELDVMKGNMSGVREYVLTMPRFKRKSTDTV